MEQLDHQQKPDLVKKILHKLFLSLNNDESRKYIQIYLIDPLMNHVLERIFPYIIITSVLFIILILSIITICVLIYYNIKNGKIV